MDPPPLKLLMLQGPREGETLEFGVRSTVRVGRVVTGNNVTIKDAGISSKHVFIGFESGQWVIRDLDSSNGTLLNSSKLTPQTSYPINHGDTIKLGEYTSILVKIDDLDSVKPPRIAGPEGNMRSSNVEGLIEDKSQSTSQILENRRRGRPRKGGALKNELKSLGIPEAVGPAKEQNWKPELQQMSLRVTRSGKNLSVDCTAMEIDDNKIRRGARRGRPPRPEPLEIIQVDDSEDDKENVKESNLEERDSEEDKKKKDNDREPPPERARVDAVKENVKGLTMQEDNCKEDINQSEHGVPKSSNKEEETLDLEKMTLGQWFDYMEVHLQKQIVEETEVLIEGMRQKAEQVHAYKMQQKKKRAKEKEKDKDVVLVNVR
ncbi:FHA domain-containing protein At4g14490-like [Tripterygium wilfordii]|uniref:FHA domain-containing protein At4g14490-like n=1 Tax=Tripterygium wilfordii TaxID=458696 RepID=UPI0018F80042|nr:FHA domain-containing protein At4g14490-like [Tripterygium wilfordii]XP_038721327.1 FHA domain-containing protein At4g14490-like [Tripterygium wilfordii]